MPVHTVNIELSTLLCPWSLSTLLCPCSSGWHPHICQLLPVCCSHIPRTRDILVQALVTRQIDYCNDILVDIPQHLYDILRPVLHTAAQLICLPRHWRVPWIQCSSNWVGCLFHRVDYKLAILAHKCQQGLSSSYHFIFCVQVLFMLYQ